MKVKLLVNNWESLQPFIGCIVDGVMRGAYLKVKTSDLVKACPKLSRKQKSDVRQLDSWLFSKNEFEVVL